MKNLLLIVIISFTTISTFAQHFPPDDRRGKMRERLEQLEKLRLFEVLDLDEETSVKFFHRQNEHRENMSKIMNKRMNLINQLHDEINKSEMTSNEYKTQIYKILDIEKELSVEKKRFVDSLWDILTPEQVAKVVTFEPRFRDELRDMIKEHNQEREKF